MSQGTEITVQFELMLDDYRAMTRYLCAPPKTAWWPKAVAWLALVVIFVMAHQFRGHDARVFATGMITIGVPVLAVCLLWQARMRRQLAPRPGGYLLCPQTLRIDEKGIATVTPHASSETLWSAVIAVDETPAHVFLRVDMVATHSIPKRAFAQPETLRSFVDYARTRASGAQ